MNDLKTTVNVQEYHSLTKVKSEDLLEIIIGKLTELKSQIQEKNSKPTSPPVYRLSSASLKPKPHFKKVVKTSEDSQENCLKNRPNVGLPPRHKYSNKWKTFEIFNLKRKRQNSEKAVVSPKDFFEGKITRGESTPAETTQVIRCSIFLCLYELIFTFAIIGEYWSWS